jgi:targeting protein for Xklp2
MSEARIKSRHERTANMEKPASTKKRYSNARRHGHTHIGRSHPSMMARPTLKVPRTLTQPVEFTFQTESRARDHHQHEEPEGHETQKQWQPVLTHPQPFKLHESRIKPCDTTTYNSPYKSTAERLKEFDTTMKLHETIVASKPLELTQPVPFNLQTSSRHRPVHVLSTEEQMRLAIENQPKFKARPFPQRIVATHGDLGVPKVEKRPLTEPSEFNLRSLQRLENRKRKRTEEEEALIEQNRERKRQFKARALNARVLAGQSDLPPVEPRPITVPQSPALSTKQRGLAHKEQLAARAKILEEAQEEARKFRARPLPEDKPFQLAPKPTQLTDPAPFTLSTEARGATYVQTMQEKVRQEEREERARREFKAQPVKVFDDTKYGHVENKPLTEPIPFNLQTDARGEVRAEQHSHYDHKNENYVFKARPMPITKPFALAKSDKPLTELSNVELRSDRRALQRSEFDERMKKKMMAIEEMQRQRQEEEERQEAEQREQLRRDIEAGLKAKPLPAFYDTYSKDPVSLTEKRLKRRLNQQRSKLTIPKTPNFATNKRMGKRESTRLR